MSSSQELIPKPIFSDLVTILGQNISGDVGGWTVYTTRRGKIVWYEAAPALRPPSPLQVKQRLRFKIAQSLWSQLTPAVKSQWEQMTKVLSLPLTGQNVFISLCFSQAKDQLKSANTKANLNLPLPPSVPN